MSSDIDIERLRRAADEWDASEQETDWQPLAEAARFLLSLSDEGGELWRHVACAEHGRSVVHWERGGQERCDDGSRVRVWPKEAE